jgi:hypothetical protein
MSQFQVEWQTVTITSGQQDSAPLALFDRSLVGMALPSTYDGTAMSFKVSRDGTTYYELDDTGTGAAIPATVAASKAYSFDPIVFMPWNFVILRAGTAQATTDTVIDVLLRRVA